MVCAIGSGKMTALVRLLDAGSALQTPTEDIGRQKLAAHYIGRELRDADEANLLDEEDMHIFGFRPMTDPLDLVCCNACKKPIKASHYTAHAELCKLLHARDESSLELDGPAVNRKPSRKERKKLPITQTKKPKSVREPQKIESVVCNDIAAPELRTNEKIQMSPFSEAKRNMHLNSTQKMNGSRVNPYKVDCSEDATKCSSQSLKRAAAESPTNPGAKNFHKTATEVLPYIPAPIATKIYYSQRNDHLRRAICHMFYEESNKESTHEASNLEALQVNATPTQSSPPGNFCHEQLANQQRDDNILNLARTPGQILRSRSNFYMVKSEAFAPSMQKPDLLPVNDNPKPHYLSNSNSFSEKTETHVPTLQQDTGSVPVV